MLMADDIQDTIDIANAKTKDAQAALGSARATAEQARDKAQQAQSISEEIQTKAETIRNEAEAAYNSSVGVNTTLAKIEERIATATSLTGNARAESEANGMKVDEVPYIPYFL